MLRNLSNPKKIWNKLYILVGMALLAFTPTLYGSSDMDQPQLETDLRTLEVEAAQIAYHAAEIQSLLRNPGSFTIESHRYELNRIRERVNTMGEMIPALQKMKLNPLQSEVVDDVSGLVKALATQTEKAIRYLAEDKATPPLDNTDKAYAVRVAGVYHFANHIDDLIDFAQARLDVRDAMKEATEARRDIR